MIFRPRFLRSPLILRKTTTLFTRRNLLTERASPSLCSTVPEKPYTIVLQEDRFFCNSSWHFMFKKSFPGCYSTEYCYQELELKNLKSSLLEMSEDLMQHPSIVLVARGPLVSWVAQFYLESLPLSGLVMVDPFVEPSAEIVKEIRRQYRIENTCTSDVGLLTQIESGFETRKLKLEPGVVPMLVLMSMKNEHLRRASKLTAERHHDPNGSFGVQSDDVGANPIAQIQTWIENEVS